MKIILLENIRPLGYIGEQVKVKSGYGRNYLLPKGKAVLATPDNISYFNAKRAELEKKSAICLAAAKIRAKKLDSMKIIIAVKVSYDNKLYGSIGPAKIVEAVVAQGGELKKQEVNLSQGQIRELGKYEIPILLHNGEIQANLKLQIINEEA